jgi:hypothetical protein
MSEEIKSGVMSRRRAVSLLGLAAAKAATVAGVGALGLAAMPTVLPVSEAEAQTAGMTRRQTRRTARRAGRATRRAVRRGTAPQ